MLMFPNIVAFLFFPNCQKQDYSLLKKIVNQAFFFSRLQRKGSALKS